MFLRFLARHMNFEPVDDAVLRVDERAKGNLGAIEPSSLAPFGIQCPEPPRPLPFGGFGSGRLFLFCGRLLFASPTCAEKISWLSQVGV
jgi:hypothetical protein